MFRGVSKLIEGYIPKDNALMLAMSAVTPYIHSVEDFDKFTEELASYLTEFPDAAKGKRWCGHWERMNKDNTRWNSWGCSVCRAIYSSGWDYAQAGQKPTANFCPSCGAVMIEDED